jgi:hypothetical protein
MENDMDNMLTHEDAVRKQAIRDTMECVKQIVLSYGPNTIAQVDRDNLCRTMDHYAQCAIDGLGKE